MLAVPAFTIWVTLCKLCNLSEVITRKMGIVIANTWSCKDYKQQALDTQYLLVIMMFSLPTSLHKYFVKVSKDSLDLPV